MSRAVRVTALIQAFIRRLLPIIGVSLLTNILRTSMSQMPKVRIGLSSTEAGVEYRKGPANISLAPTLGVYSDRERPGVAVDAGYALDDQWSLGAHGRILHTRHTPACS